MNIGYARVSTGEQNLDLQVDALEQADCKTILQEKISGTISERPKLEEALNFMRDGDTLVVWRLATLASELPRSIMSIS